MIMRLNLASVDGVGKLEFYIVSSTGIEKKNKIKRSAGIEERNILMYKHISISIYRYKRRKIERLEGRKNAILSRRLNCDQG